MANIRMKKWWQTSCWKWQQSFQEKWDKMFRKVHLIFGGRKISLLVVKSLTLNGRSLHLHPTNSRLAAIFVSTLQWPEGGQSVLTLFQFPMLPFKTTINPPPKTTECPLESGQIIFQPLFSKFHGKLCGGVQIKIIGEIFILLQSFGFFSPAMFVVTPFLVGSYPRITPRYSSALQRRKTSPEMEGKNPPGKLTNRNWKIPHVTNRKYINSFMVDFPVSGEFCGGYPFGKTPPCCHARGRWRWR